MTTLSKSYISLVTFTALYHLLLTKTYTNNYQSKLIHDMKRKPKRQKLSKTHQVHCICKRFTLCPLCCASLNKNYLHKVVHYAVYYAVNFFANKENTTSKPTLTTAKTTTKIFVQIWFQIPSTSKGSIITFTGLIITQWSKLIHTNSSNIYTLLCSSIQTIINNIFNNIIHHISTCSYTRAFPSPCLIQN